MSTRIRLARGGSKKRPYYRIVVANSRAPRDGDFIEKVGTYNPLLEKTHTDRVILKKERIEYWQQMFLIYKKWFHRTACFTES